MFNKCIDVGVFEMEMMEKKSVVDILAIVRQLLYVLSQYLVLNVFITMENTSLHD